MRCCTSLMKSVARILVSSCLLPLIVEAAEALLHQLGLHLNVEAVLGDLTGDAEHIEGLPQENISVLMQKLGKGHLHS